MYQQTVKTIFNLSLKKQDTERLFVLELDHIRIKAANIMFPPAVFGLTQSEVERVLLSPGSRDEGLPRLEAADGLLRLGLLRGPAGPFLCGEITRPSDSPQSSSSSREEQSGSPTPREDTLRRCPSWRNRGEPGWFMLS